MTTKKPKLPEIQPYNPLDKKHLGESVAEALLEQDVTALPPMPFIGAGIYAIYYLGDFPLYQEITKSNDNGSYKWPIYVGKAVPPGARKGGFGLGANPGQALYKRLDEHSKSIERAENLNIKDFHCRFLVVEDIWIPLAESLLIEMFSPLWNKTIDGFGNHDPGKGRYEQQRSLWDELHPGRVWASRLRPNSQKEFEIHDTVAQYILTTKKKL